MNLSTRPATEADSEALLLLCRQLGYDPTPEDLVTALGGSNETHAVLIVEVGGAAVGWVEVEASRHLTTGPEALISGLVVDETCRGQGIGKALVAAAEAWAQDRGITAIRVRSRVHREKAHQFYLRLGYEEAKRQVVFRKPLGKGSSL